MSTPRFATRADAGRRLAECLADRARTRGCPFVRPLVLAVPRGGIEVAAPIAAVLDAELDVVLARKLRCPMQPELAIGALAEDGTVHLNALGRTFARDRPDVIEAERREQAQRIERRRARVRAVRPAAPVEGRTVIVVDDGIATGATMRAAIATVRARRPREIVVGLPVAPPDSIDALEAAADEIVCLAVPPGFMAVGQYYDDFTQVTDDRVSELLAADRSDRD